MSLCAALGPSGVDPSGSAARELDETVTFFLAVVTHLGTNLL